MKITSTLVTFILYHMLPKLATNTSLQNQSCFCYLILFNKIIIRFKLRFTKFCLQFHHTRLACCLHRSDKNRYFYLKSTVFSGSFLTVVGQKMGVFNEFRISTTIRLFFKYMFIFVQSPTFSFLVAIPNTTFLISLNTIHCYANNV